MLGERSLTIRDTCKTVSINAVKRPGQTTSALRDWNSLPIDGTYEEIC